MSEFETSFACWQWQHVWRMVNPMPPGPAPTFAINDCITHKQQHALNDFVLDLVKSRDSCSNNNINNNNNNNIHSMTLPQCPDLNDLVDPALNDPDSALNDLDLARNDLDPPMMTHVRCGVISTCPCRPSLCSAVSLFGLTLMTSLALARAPSACGGGRVISHA